MTAQEMQVEFERRLHLISPDTVIENKPTSNTIFSFLNAAQDRYCVLNYIGDDQTIADTNLFKKNVDAIKSLVVTKRLPLNSMNELGLPRFLLPYNEDDHYLLYISSTSNVTGTYKQYTSTVRLKNEMVKYADLNKYVETADNAPIVRTIAVAYTSDVNTKLDYLVAAGDKYTMFDSIDLTYYRRPRRFNLLSDGEVIDKCELPDTVHSEIVDLAVDMFITEAKYRLNMKRPNTNSNE